jgi:hypothetical protein
MLRVLLGLIKGGLVGAGVGFLATKVGLVGGPMTWLAYGAVGFLVGLVCGKALWRQETLWTPILKGIFGVVVSLGLAWGAHKLLGGLVLPINAQLGVAKEAPLVDVPLLLAPLLGMVYGIFVEVDDGERKKAAAEAAAQAKA